MTAADNQAYLTLLFARVHDQYNRIDHETSKNNQNKNK